MTRNVGTMDRMARGVGALGLGVCAFMAPLPLSIGLAGFGMIAVYLLFTSLAGTCLGYRLMGKSTGPMETR